MKTGTLALLVSLALPTVALADDNPFGALGKKVVDVAKDEGTKAGKKELNKQVVSKVNAKLLAEGRKNQCSFKKDSDELAPGCDAKAKRLANVLIDVKKTLAAAGHSGYKFVVTGHTDTVGDPGHNKTLSEKRAAAIVRELTAKGIPAGELRAVGMGADKPLVKPDNTEAKRARNRRYEIQVEI